MQTYYDNVTTQSTSTATETERDRDMRQGGEVGNS